MSISAADVKALRDRTGAGMMDCKKALKEADGDFEQAVEILRKKGQKVSEKRSDRETNQGIVVTLLGDDKSKGLALALNCETDFVARNDDFVEKANQFAQLAFDNNVASVEELHELELEGLTVEKHLETLVGKIGEKIEISGVAILEGAGTIVEYNHPGDQLGVIVQFEGELDDKEAGRDVAMQVAAMNPIGVTRDDVPSDTVEKELEIAKEQLLSEGKPAEIAEKAAQGKLRRFYEERVLLEQKFVKDGSLSVQKFLESQNAPLVKAFVRKAVGDNA
jgi:elongation factor Ts